MEQEWIIYELNGDCYKITCEKNKIKENVQIVKNLIDDQIECYQIQEQEPNKYIAISFKMLELQKIDQDDKNNQITELTLQNNSLQMQIKELKRCQKVNICVDQFQTKKETIIGQLEEIKNLEELLEEKVQENQALQIKYDNECKLQKQYNNTLKTKNQEIINSREKILTLSKQLDSTTKELELKSKELELKSKELELKSKEFELKSQELTQKVKDLELKPKKFNQQVLISENDLNEEINSLKEEIQNLIIKNDKKLQLALETQKKQLDQQLEDYQQQIEKLQNQLNYNSNQCIESQINELQQENSFLLEELARLKIVLQQKNEDIENKNNKCIKYEDDIQLLKRELDKQKIINRLKNPQIETQLTDFQNNQLNFKLSEMYLDDISDLSFISLANLSEKQICQYSEEDYNSALKQHILDPPFISQILQFSNQQLIFKIKQINQQKYLSQNQIKQQILNNLLFYELIKLYDQKAYNSNKQVINFSNLRVPRQFIIQVSNGNYFYCEELIKGDSILYNVNRNLQKIEKVFNEFFINCYNKINKKRIFTQLSFNKDAYVVSNVIGYEISNSHFDANQILEQFSNFNKLIVKEISLEETRYE